MMFTGGDTIFLWFVHHALVEKGFLYRYKTDYRKGKVFPLVNNALELVIL